MQSIIQRNLKNVRVRDYLLKIASLCPGFTLFKSLSNIESINQIFSTVSPQILTVLDACSQENKSTRLIQTLDWPRDLDMLTFCDSSCIVDEETIKKKLEVKTNAKTDADKRGWV